MEYLHMPRWMRAIIVVCAAMLLFAACGRETAFDRRTQPVGEETAGEASAAEDGKPPEIEGLTFSDEMSLAYAKEFHVYHYEDGYTLIAVGERKYLILPEGERANKEGFPSDLILLQAGRQHLSGGDGGDVAV